MKVVEFTNREIMEYAEAIYNNFLSEENVILPIKANFYLQKNYKNIIEAAKTFEECKISIGKKYGTLDESGNYIVPNESLEQAQTELNELLELKQNIEIMFVDLDSLEDIQLNTKQMRALMFMIEA